MEYSTGKIERELNAGGMEFERGSVYERFCKLTDLRSVHGKRYELEGVLTIIVFAKLCGEDKPMGIAEWAKHRKEELVRLLGLNWSRMPHHNTYRRILAYHVYEQEVARLVGEYNQGVLFTHIDTPGCLLTSHPGHRWGCGGDNDARQIRLLWPSSPRNQ